MADRGGENANAAIAPRRFMPIDLKRTPSEETSPVLSTGMELEIKTLIVCGFRLIYGLAGLFWVFGCF